MGLSRPGLALIAALLVIVFASPVVAFGAGNIASISAIEGKNWRHGDIEDVLKTVACVKGYKWTSLMIKRDYFGNWLRDYSQAMDTATLGKAQPETIRILVWLLSFMSFGYATVEFEVTPERLGVYRPEEHIDNPKNYNDDKDARAVDPRLRGPVEPIELEVDPGTGMKNYIANTQGHWATSAAYIGYSFERSIHHGRRHAEGRGLLHKGDDDELAEALRYLGQGLHCMEDFGAHSNYVELALRELGMHNVFPHTGTATAISLHGKHTFPLVTGTFGMVDFFHSVLGEATDHFTQSEINEMDEKLGGAESTAQSSNPLNNFTSLLTKIPGTRGLAEEAEGLQQSSQAQARSMPQDGSARSMGDDISQPPVQQPPHWPHAGPGHPQDLAQQGQWGQAPPGQPWGYQPQQPAGPGWDQSQYQSQQWPHQPQYAGQWAGQHPGSGWHQPAHQPPAEWGQQQWQSSWNQHPASHEPGQWGQRGPEQDDWQGSPGEQARGPGLQNIDPVKTAKQIYPILVFRDKVVRTISSTISKIPGLEALVERVTETLTIFIFSLLAPFIRPLLKVLTKQLQASSSVVIHSSGRHQYEPWTDPYCTDPTHSMLSKDHFSNILNDPAGQVAAEIVKFVAPRVMHAWDHPSEPVQGVLDDCMRVFHHPAIRDEHNEVQRKMFDIVATWARDPEGGAAYDLNDLLASDAVRSHRNHISQAGDRSGHGHGLGPDPSAYLSG